MVREKGRETLTRITSFSTKICGTHEDRKLATKGAETFGFLLYLIDLTDRLEARLPLSVRGLREAGKCQLRIVEAWQGAPARMSEEDQRTCCAAWVEYCEKVRTYPELHEQPKKHATFHLLYKTRWFGNPRLYANWLDEHLNKLLKSSCRFCSQATLESSVLCRMKLSLRSTHLKRKSDALL